LGGVEGFSMAIVWITYAWDDNKNQDVDFVAHGLESAGVKVKLDRWNIHTGRRLWEQIEKFIQDKKQSDAWLMYATPNSLGSEACKEEYAYALNRDLHTRDGAFPVIALFPASVDTSLIPAGIRTRLYVSLTDPDWKERIVAAAEGRTPDVTGPGWSPSRSRFTKGRPGWRASSLSKCAPGRGLGARFWPAS
jgi:hypothetical protein